MTDNYLDNYLKVEMLNNIIETLFCTAGDVDFLSRLKEFAANRLSNFHKQIARMEQNKVRGITDESNLKKRPKLLGEKNINKVLESKELPGLNGPSTNLNKVGYRILKLDNL